jgi:hypothetical protein
MFLMSFWGRAKIKYNLQNNIFKILAPKLEQLYE